MKQLKIDIVLEKSATNNRFVFARNSFQEFTKFFSTKKEKSLIIKLLSKFSILFCFYVEEETAEGTGFEKVGIGWLVGWLVGLI